MEAQDIVRGASSSFLIASIAGGYTHPEPRPKSATVDSL